MAVYTPLTALDQFFLAVEDRKAHMHVSGTFVLESGPLDTGSGGIDIDAIRAYIETRLDGIPRYRQRLSRNPIGNGKLWVDDRSFNPAYHIRHVSVPRPGTERQLKRLVAWINSQQLDRKKPLWEMWIIEGLEDGRFAIVNKVHHCMIDGVAGVDLMSTLLSATPESTSDQHPSRWSPEPLPSTGVMLRDALLRWSDAPAALGKDILASLRRSPTDQWESARSTFVGLTAVATSAITPASPTSFNAPIGCHRRFDWLSFDLAEVKAIKNQLGGTVNDVVLATVTRATQRFLEKRDDRGVHKERLFRALCPVNVRDVNNRAVMGNRVAGMLVDLPLHERELGRQYDAVRENARLRKESFQSAAIELIEQVGEWMAPSVLLSMERFAARNLLYNMIVTNVPGPPTSLYLLGARVTDLYPQVPLFENQGLGVALFSYDGRLCCGINADRDIVPDLHDFIGALEASFAELLVAANAAQERSSEAATHARHGQLEAVSGTVS